MASDALPQPQPTGTPPKSFGERAFRTVADAIGVADRVAMLAPNQGQAKTQTITGAAMALAEYLASFPPQFDALVVHRLLDQTIAIRQQRASQSASAAVQAPAAPRTILSGGRR